MIRFLKRCYAGHEMRYRLRLFVLLFTVTLWLPAEEQVDLSIVHRIRTEAFENSKVMDHMFHLTDVNGPRLTGSSGYRKAADWVVAKAREYGLSNPRLEKWGPFGRGWEYSKFSAHMLEPAYSPLIGFPLAWSSGTNGPLTGQPSIAVIQTPKDLENFKGKLKGRIVMVDPVRETPLLTDPLAKRYSDADLLGLEQAPEPGAAPRKLPGDFRTPEQLRAFRNKRIVFFKEEGVRAVIFDGATADGGTVFASRGGSNDLKVPVPPPMVALTPEHYNRIVRLIEKKIPVRIELDIGARAIEENQDSSNVVAEIPGIRKNQQLVMIGAHLDSWQGGTGATDNAAGCAVALEVMRILKSLQLPMDRAVRLALWSGEEQGLLGSKAYVKQHFADPARMELKPEHALLSAYFNLDNGTGKIRGVYLQGNDMMRPVFSAWFSPFKDLGAPTISIRNTGGTDHLSFDAVGLPGFQFIQDPMEYGTRTHHSNMDVYDHVSAGDLMQAAAIMASFVYNAATREEMLPRKPLPKPKPQSSDRPASPPTGGAR
ncbi:MAG: M20/M25/M40 family metallo-hydrolase [Bryobacterales bacterium]|nr:M20/M25/M40 family metallo-hydrolase [Bryobacterales bacterium]